MGGSAIVFWVDILGEGRTFFDRNAVEFAPGRKFGDSGKMGSPKGFFEVCACGNA
jgi:hypothetical protein